ncbi:circadian clock-controlled protein daywake [Dendroctonus ponderosae]|uniref:Haemolymph juvenile hormone binding protein n=1 Tax=Dendroctonus ponderosae TaxID=77166 RepID=A0AAR5PEA8_DENPD|nr:circadian clock-controlled protein daywake [Dendroctonus ponderosae]KAH1011364.1 hypothetical protein HUJ04_000750 [Dendroctonus ponderosae]KAH1018744.1 hypothetical protein HUJ05_006455 [Dendroctonus ponderosae]
MSRVLVSLLLVFSAACYADQFTFCKVGQSGADKCLTKNIESAIRSLKNGAPEYGLISLDPLHVDKITIDANQTVQLVQYYTNIDLSGFSDVDVKKAHYDPGKKLLSVLGLFPRLIQVGNCMAKGKLLSLVVEGNGNSTLTLDNTEILVNIQFEDTTKDGKTFFKIKSFVMNITPKRMTSYYANLFNGNQLLSDNILKLINEEWETLYNDVKPSINENYASIFKKYGEVFFDKVPADTIFPK